MCYLKLLKLFKPIVEGYFFETFRWDLKWDVLFETFETWNFWNFSTHHKSCLFETFRWDLNEICYLKLLKLFNPSQELLIWNFQMRFEMRYAIWNIWNVLNLKLFKHVTGVAFFKLSDETWKKMWYSKYLKLFKLETFHTFQIHQRVCLYETFREDLKWDLHFETFWNFWNFAFETVQTWNFEVSFKDKKFQLTLNLEVLVHRVDICC